MASAEATTIRDEIKETLLNDRIEEIRRKNEALKKRHEEVEADKRNAGVVEGRSPSTTSTDKPPREVKPKRLPAKQRLGRVDPVKTEATTDVAEQRPQRLKKDDGPPPDPSYSFLADRNRDRANESSKDDRRQGSRRHPGNFGGQDFNNTKSEIKKQRSYEKNAPPRRFSNSKMEMEMSMTGRERREYEHWRSERKGIEEARVNRQKTTTGEWRREWDKEKDRGLKNKLVD